MNRPVLLDNTVLTNFALLNRPDLVLGLWGHTCTTLAVRAGYQVGVTKGQLPADTWQSLATVTLTSAEAAFAQQLRHRLGAGERTCIAVAYHREGLFASDDLDARQQAEVHGIHTTGTVGILALNVRQECLTLVMGNELLLQLINLGYRSPVTTLDGHV